MPNILSSTCPTSDADVQGTPVWRQLEELCEGSPLLAPARLRQLMADNEQLQQKVQEQQATISQLMQQMGQVHSMAGELKQLARM